MTNTEVIQRYSELVMTVAAAKVSVASDAEDVYQEVFCRYIDKQPKFRSEDHARAWFIKVTVNVVRSMYRRYEFKKRADVEDEAVEWERSARTLTGEKLTDDRFAELIEQQVDFNEVMRRMNPDYKAVLLLHFDCGYTVREIAKLLGESEIVVKNCLVRGKQRYKEILLERNEINESVE